MDWLAEALHETATNDAERGIQVTLSEFGPGVHRMPAREGVTIRMHLGASVEVTSSRAGRTHQGRAIAGDLDIVPARTAATWQRKRGGTTLVMHLTDPLLRRVAHQLDMDPDRVAIGDRFQLRDPVLEHIGWAFKAELDTGWSGGHVIRESLGGALAARVLQRHSNASLPIRTRVNASGWRLKRALAHIEDNLEGDLSVRVLAGVTGLGATCLKTLFREKVGTPVHQYVVRRRVERAKLLLKDRNMSITEVAVATGFAHQSHLGRQMKRVLGTTPMAVRVEMQDVAAAE